MNNFNFLWDRYDLTALNAILSWWGVVMCVWCHQLWGMGAMGVENGALVRVAQRAAFMLIALSFLWTMAYAHVRNWQPWPSYITTVMGLDLFLASVLWVALRRGVVWR